MKTISNTDDLIDVRDVIEHFEELENTEEREDEEQAEFETLEKLLDDLKGNGGDEQWRGDWYPVTLIHESYFTDYTREMLEDIGYISKDFPSWIAINWEETAENVQVDYTSIDFDGETYWTR